MSYYVPWLYTRQDSLLSYYKKAKRALLDPLKSAFYEFERVSSQDKCFIIVVL